MIDIDEMEWRSSSPEVHHHRESVSAATASVGRWTELPMMTYMVAEPTPAGDVHNPTVRRGHLNPTTNLNECQVRTPTGVLTNQLKQNFRNPKELKTRVILKRVPSCKFTLTPSLTQLPTQKFPFNILSFFLPAPSVVCTNSVHWPFLG